MAIDIIEDLENANLGRPLKGLMLENGIHIFDTKQEILEEQALSLDRVENAVIFARDIKKFLIFDETGESFEERDVPGGSDFDDYVKKNSNAELNKVNINGIRGVNAYNNFSIKGSSDGGDDGDGLIFKTYIRADQNPNKDYIQYFGGTGGGKQLANTESVIDAIAEDKAKGEWIGGVFKDTINDTDNPNDDFTCNDPKQWLEYRKTSFNGGFALTVNQGQDLISSEIVIHLHVTSGMTSAAFKVVTNDGKEVTRTIRVGEKWRFYLRSGATPYFELIDDGMQSGTIDSDYDGEGFGVPGRTETGHGTIVQSVITGNYRNTSNQTGDLIINLRTDNGVKNFRFYYSLPYGTLDSGRKVFAKVDSKAGSSKTIRAGEIWQCEIKVGQFFDDFFWQKITDGSSTFVVEEDVINLIDENNDEIITPNQGAQFQLIDADKSIGYGDNGTITYYGPNYSTGQAGDLINKLANSKSYFVHKETSSQYGFAMLHESYVSQIYNQDVTGISELTMLFGPKSRGRLSKYNQVTPTGMVLNWNGEYLPDTEDPNAVNPTSWIDLDGNVTTEWSKTGIKTACYSIGLMANDGSALLQRGDVFCHDDAGVKTSTFTADSASEFFVIPIKTGGGTLSDLKILPLFMSRLYETQNEWESYTFDNSADCVGAILKIAYDSAIESAGDSDKLVAAIAENNLAQADLQTRFGAGTVEINNLEFTVDSITATNLNGEE